MSADTAAHSRRARIVNSRGLHARASRSFVECASQFNAAVWVEKDRQQVLADSIMELLMLGAGPGDEIAISAAGPEAEDAVNALKELVESGFGERR